MASITTFFGTQGGGGSVSGTATRVAFFGGTPGSPSTTLDDSANLEWDDTNSRLSVGDATTVASTLTVAGAGATDSTSAFEVRTSASRADLLLFRVYDNGRIDSRMLNSSEALTSSMAIGLDAGSSLTTGIENTFVGTNAGELNTTGQSNTCVGSAAGRFITTRAGHTYIGAGAGSVNNATTSNTVVGAGALGLATTGGGNVAIGTNAARNFPGPGQANPSNGVYIGTSTQASSATPTNEIVIGSNATGAGSNTVVIGGTAILNTYLNGNVNISDGKNIVFDSGTGTQIGTAASQKLAMWGKTPIVQPTTAGGSATVSSPGAGNTIKTDDTFDGYTLAQVVRALRNIGVLQ